jgi:hypothetical protein
MRRWHCQTCTRVPATRSVRVLPTTTLKNERGRREDRVPARTRGPRAAKVARGRTTGGAGSSGLPCAMVLRLIRDLPGDRALLPPSSVDHSTTLAPASGRQDHTISPSAPAPLVLRRQNVHRIPLPTSVTIAIRPSCGGGTARTLRLIWVSEKAKYFCGKGWTAESKNSPTGKSVALAAVLRASRSLLLRIFHRHREEPSCPPKAAFERRRMHRAAYAALDCFAHRTAPCAEPAARNDD